MSQNASLRVLTVSSLVMITIGSIDTLRNLPASALFSESLIFFYLLAAVLFFIPTALVAAEMATGWPSRGGVYTWVKEAFGPGVGLFAIWYQWIGTVIWYPTILSFLAGTIAQLTIPSLAQKSGFMVTVIVVLFWIATIANLYGMKTSARVAKICTFLGLIVPICLLMLFAGLWLITNNPSQLSFEKVLQVPDLNPAMLTGLSAIILSCCGVEITSTHALEVKHPQRDYPRAMIFSALTIILTLILGSLSIALIIPKEEIGLVTGVIQVFDAVLSQFGLQQWLPLLGMTVIFSVLGIVNNWVIGPCKGLLFSFKELKVMNFLHYENKQQVPAGILIFQACLCTVLSLVFFLMPNVNSSYWLLTVLATQLYTSMYCLLFAAAFWLRVKKPEVIRAYKVPGGTIGMGFICFLGISSCVLTTLIGFYPPPHLNIPNQAGYTIALLAGCIIFSCPPLLFYRAYLRSKSSFFNIIPDQT